MAHNPEERLLVCMLQPVGVGEVFERLPLHVTVPPWFTATRLPAFKNALSNFAYEQAPLVVEGGEIAMFGAREDIKVRTLRRAGELSLMHGKLGQLIQRFEGEVNTSHTGENYLPHVTNLYEEGLAEGERAELKALQLFNRGDKNTKVVEQVFYFRGN